MLLIEDDPIERQRIGSFIEAAGYDVTRAASGEEGLALLRSRPFAAVVLDLIMPEMTGLDVLRAARTEDRLADVRFIVLSAMYMTKNERQVLGPRVADVVRKGETMPRALTFALAPGGQARACGGRTCNPATAAATCRIIGGVASDDDGELAGDDDELAPAAMAAPLRLSGGGPAAVDRDGRRAADPRGVDVAARARPFPGSSRSCARARSPTPTCWSRRW